MTARAKRRRRWRRFRAQTRLGAQAALGALAASGVRLEATTASMVEYRLGATMREAFGRIEAERSGRR